MSVLFHFRRRRSFPVLGVCYKITLCSSGIVVPPWAVLQDNPLPIGLLFLYLFFPFLSIVTKGFPFHPKQLCVRWLACLCQYKCDLHVNPVEFICMRVWWHVNFGTFTVWQANWSKHVYNGQLASHVALFTLTTLCLVRLSLFSTVLVSCVSLLLWSHTVVSIHFSLWPYLYRLWHRHKTLWVSLYFKVYNLFRVIRPV